MYIYTHIYIYIYTYVYNSMISVSLPAAFSPASGLSMLNEASRTR